MAHMHAPQHTYIHAFFSVIFFINIHSAKSAVSVLTWPNSDVMFSCVCVFEYLCLMVGVFLSLFTPCFWRQDPGPWDLAGLASKTLAAHVSTFLLELHGSWPLQGFGGLDSSVCVCMETTLLMDSSSQLLHLLSVSHCPTVCCHTSLAFYSGLKWPLVDVFDAFFWGCLNKIFLFCFLSFALLFLYIYLLNNTPSGSFCGPLPLIIMRNP